MIARRIQDRNSGIAQRSQDRQHLGKFSRLAGTGKVSSADHNIGAGVENVSNRLFQFPEIVAEAAAETVIENPDPAFVDISEHVFRRAAGVRIGKMNDFHAPDISPSCFRLAIPPCRTGIDE